MCFLPPGCRLQDVFQMWCDLGPEFCLFLSSPKAGIFCVVLFLVSCFLSPPCVLAGAHFCGFWPKGMFWSCQEGRRRRLANPRMKVLRPPPPLTTVLRSREELPRPGSASPPHVSRVCPVLPLASAAYINLVPTWSFRRDYWRRGPRWGGRR